MKFLQERLKLNINVQKSAIDYPSRRKFLGFSFTFGWQVKLRIAPKTRIKFKEKIRELTKRNWGISMKERLKKLNEYLIGWIGYFGIIETKSVLQELDEWIRRRLRMCLLKQWKLGKTKLAKLKDLGIEGKWAGRIAFSDKKYWRLANTPQINKALGLAYWREQGLVSLVERYYEMLAKVST